MFNIQLVAVDLTRKKDTGPSISWEPMGDGNVRFEVRWIKHDHWSVTICNNDQPCGHSGYCQGWRLPVPPQLNVPTQSHSKTNTGKQMQTNIIPLCLQEDIELGIPISRLNPMSWKLFLILVQWVPRRCWASHLPGMSTCCWIPFGGIPSRVSELETPWNAHIIYYIILQDGIGQIFMYNRYTYIYIYIHRNMIHTSRPKSLFPNRCRSWLDNSVTGRHDPAADY